MKQPARWLRCFLHPSAGGLFFVCENRIFGWWRFEQKLPKTLVVSIRSLVLGTWEAQKGVWEVQMRNRTFVCLRDSDSCYARIRKVL
jgi:hypothetical protein